MKKQNKVPWQVKLYPKVYNYFASESDLLRRLIEHQHSETKHIKDTRTDQLYLLLASIYSCSSAILTLLKNLAYLNECYMLSRALLERVINYLYLLCCEEEEFKKFIMYNKYRQVRALDREVKVGEHIARIKMSVPVNYDLNPELQEALDMFTSKKGKMINKWTPLSILERLDRIANLGKFDIRYLLVSNLSIYQDASEALHGSIYGFTFQFGTTKGKREDPANFVESVHGNACVLCVQLGTCLHTLFESYNKTIEIDKLFQESRRNTTTLSSTLDKTGIRSKPGITLHSK